MKNNTGSLPLRNWEQSLANNCSDEQIWIWILFAKDIFYKYEYEHLVSRMWIRILFKKTFRNIFKYLNILELLKVVKPWVTTTYQSEECEYDIKTICLTFDTPS